MTKIEQVRKEMMEALKARDTGRKDALSALLSALKAKAIDKRADLTAGEENAVVYREIKQAQETMEASPADRTDTIDECRRRIAVYSEFVPRLMTEDEIRAEITAMLGELGLEEPTAKSRGVIMKALMPRVRGRADGGLVSRLVGERLH